MVRLIRVVAVLSVLLLLTACEPEHETDYFSLTFSLYAPEQLQPPVEVFAVFDERDTPFPPFKAELREGEYWLATYTPTSNREGDLPITTRSYNLSFLDWVDDVPDEWCPEHGIQFRTGTGDVVAEYTAGTCVQRDHFLVVQLFPEWM